MNIGLTILVVFITIICILLTLIVLIQNPKGGGLGATFGGFSNQMMGVARTTDLLEKATWTLAIVLIVFSLASSFFIDTTVVTQQAPAQQQQAPAPQPGAGGAGAEQPFGE